MKGTSSCVPLLSIAELDTDPHGIFRRYRPVSPLIKRDDGSYIALRMRDAEALMFDPRTRQMETDLMRSRGITSGPLYQFFENTMLTSNGQTHRRRRAPLSRALGIRVVEALRPRIRAIANELIDEVITTGRMSFLDQYAAPIPARLIGEIIGLNVADMPRLARWVYNLTRALNASFTPPEVPEIEAATAELAHYVAAQLADRREHPREDFLTSFLQAVEREGVLSPTEAMTQIMTLIVGGSDTTRAALTMLVGQLLEHRDQWDAVVRDHGLIGPAIMESLRYDSVVGAVPRFVSEEMQFDGRVIPANSIVSVSILSMQRDEELYAEPDTFDIWRTDHPSRHFAFGGGVHRCLGESLARAELEESLAVLVQRLPSLRLIGNPPTLLGHSGLRRIVGMDLGW
jgi:cytochrome P450